MRTTSIIIASLLLVVASCSGCQPEKKQDRQSVFIDVDSVKLTMKPMSPDRPYTYSFEIRCDCTGFQGMAVELEVQGIDYPVPQHLMEFTLKDPNYAVLIEGQNGGFADVRKLRVYPADATGHANAAPINVMLLDESQDGSFKTDLNQTFLPGRQIQGRIARTGPALEVLVEAKPEGLYLNGKLVAPIQ